MTRPTESLIVRVIQSYHPDWAPPKDTGKAWKSCLCPFHGDSSPSASVSFENNAFNCFACGVKGDAIGIIMREEGMGYRQAVEHAEKVSPGSNREVSREPPRKRRRRSFGEQGSDATSGPSENREVSPGLRGRTTPWS